MRRLALFLLAASLATGCVSGIDQKPYDIQIGPRLPALDPGDNPGLIFLGMAVLVVVSSICVATEHCPH